MARQRSVGVIVSGVMAILGSLAIIVMGTGFFADWLALRSTLDVDAPYSIAFFSGFIVVVGFFGVLSAVDLLKLKDWARLSFLGFAGVVGLLSIPVAFVLGLFRVFVGNFPELGSSPTTFTSLFVVSVVLSAIAVWWLIYFNRPGVRSRFL